MSEYPIVGPEQKIAIPSDIVVSEVKRLIEDGVTLSELQRSFDLILQGHATKVKLTLLAVAQKRFNRILRQLDLVDELEQTLFSAQRLQNADQKELLELLRYLSDQTSKALDFVQKVVNVEHLELAGLDEPNRGSNFTLNQMNFGETVGSQEGREAIRELFSKIGSIIETAHERAALLAEGGQDVGSAD